MVDPSSRPQLQLAAASRPAYVELVDVRDLLCGSIFLGVGDEEIDEVSYFDVVFEWMAEVGMGLEIVLVASPDLFVG